MRDHQLKNEIGKIEDQLRRFAANVDKIATDFEAQGATAHAEFYVDVHAEIATAARYLEAAYSLLLNGDETLGIEPLEDELAVR